MSWILLFTERYNGRAARFLRRHPELRDAYRNTLLLLEVNPHHPIDIGSHDAVCRG